MAKTLWANLTLSTLTTIGYLEKNIASIDPNYANKIVVAKARIGTEILSYAKSCGYPVDIDQLTNLTVLSDASDNLVISLCYRDASRGDVTYGQFGEKADYYDREYKRLMKVNLPLIQRDQNKDGVDDNSEATLGGEPTLYPQTEVVR